MTALAPPVVVEAVTVLMEVEGGTMLSTSEECPDVRTETRPLLSLSGLGEEWAFQETPQGTLEEAGFSCPRRERCSSAKTASLRLTDSEFLLRFRCAMRMLRPQVVPERVAASGFPDRQSRAREVCSPAEEM